MDLSEHQPDQFEVSNEVFQAQNIYTQRPNQRNSSRERVRNGEHDYIQETILETDEENKLEEEQVSNPHISEMNLEEYLNSKSSQPQTQQTQQAQYNPHINTIEDGTPNAGFSGYIN
jgi:hypothetical protein